MWNGAATQECGEKVLAKNSVCAQRGIPALGDSVLPNESAAFAEKCSRDVWNASLTVFFAKKVTITSSFVGESLRGSIFEPRRDRAFDRAFNPHDSRCVMLRAKAWPPFAISTTLLHSE